MKINYLKINGFGKLQNKEINFYENINIIYGENEAGKTTLLKFISGMFYGISKNKNKKEFSDYERYKPWGQSEFSGKINYKLDNNEEFEIFRDFNKKNPQIYNNNSEEISKQFNINKTKGNEFFYEQTKIDEEMFFSTTLVEQKGVILDDNNQSLLTQKIANILSTGHENTSYKKTIDKLNKKLVEEVGTERTVGRPLNILDQKIEETNNKKKNIEIDGIKKEELEKKKETIQNSLKDKQAKIDLIKEIKKLKEENIIEDEKIKINENLKNEEINKLNNIKNKLKENKLNKKNNNYLFFTLLFLIILNIILIILKINKIFIFILSGLIILNLFIILLNKIKNKKEKKLQEKYINKDEIETINNNIKNIENKINEINNQIEEKNINKNKIIKNKYKDKIDVNEINYLLEENIEEINLIIDDLENSISSLKLQLHTNEFDYNNLIKRLEEKVNLEEKLQNYLEEKEELDSLNISINLAKEAIDKAYNKMKNEITPKFTKTLSYIIDNISNGKYKNVKFIDGEGIIVELENGEYVNANKLSTGTIEQLYLALRLSAIEEITEEKMPIILDESFAYYDTERLLNILNYLNENYKDNQIIIFTCSNREKEILEKNNIKYNFIKL